MRQNAVPTPAGPPCLHLLPQARHRWASFLSKRSIAVFSVVTVTLTFGVALLPLPMLLTPSLAVLFPTLVAIGLLGLTGGLKQVGDELFSAGQWRPNLRWLLIPVGFFLAQSLLVAVLAAAIGYPVQVSVPALSPLHLAIVVFAALEEIGWRGFALPRLLRSWSPLAASLLIAVPWAGLHFAFMLPGELLAGTPPPAHSLFILSVTLLLTWVYQHARGSLFAVTWMHTWINAPGLLTVGDAVALTWLSAAAWAGLAVLILIVTRGRLGPPAAGIEKEAAAGDRPS
jgi:membrane protease YdiL (CAAX protease family)